MTELSLPISKSLLARQLILQAMHHKPLQEIDELNSCDDVRVLRRALVAIERGDNRINVQDSGTALRFLTAYAATLSDRSITITGSPRLCQRPIRPLIDIIEQFGTTVSYLAQPGFAPFTLSSRGLTFPAEPIPVPTSETTQFASALLLIGAPVLPESDSPYIYMSRELARAYAYMNGPESSLPQHYLESDWSSAAFWYEYIALHGGELCLGCFYPDSLQGDSVLPELFAPLGVCSSFDPENGLLYLSRQAEPLSSSSFSWDFTDCPDLYPPVAVTCHCLGIPLFASGLERLPYKESNRILSVQTLLDTPENAIVRTYSDHRIAMAALAAGQEVDDTACIAKSYPQFLEHLYRLQGITLIIPRRGINDDNLGKKHALHKLISAADTPYVLLRDDDVIPSLSVPATEADLVILPLRMDGGDSLIERLQRAEYAAIQEVTMAAAKRGRAVMCSGANLLVRRERWLESWPNLHPEIPSGDDMFLLESFKHRGLAIEVADAPAYEATVHPLTSWRALLRQRMRWAGKAPHYTDRDIRRYGARIVLLNVLQLLCPLFLLLKFPYEYRLIKKRDPKVSLSDALLLEILYPIYMLIVLLGGLVSQRRW